MKLSRVKINNYRQFDNLEIKFSDVVTVIAGANNSGKTSITTLLDSVFNSNGEKYYTSDIPTAIVKEWSDRLYSLLNAIYNGDDEQDKDITTIFIDDEKHGVNLLPCTSIKIQVDYKDDDDIQQFADYIMDFDETKSSFYFLYKYEVSLTELIEQLKENERQIIKYLKIEEDETIRGRMLKSFLVDLYLNCVHPKVYFCDEEYANICNIENIKEFRNLFNYGFLKAGRQLDDEPSEHTHNLSKQMLKNASLAEEWNVAIDALPTKLRDQIKNEEIIKTIQESSKNALQDTLNAIEKANGSDKTELILDLNVGVEDVDAFIVKVLSASYDVNGYYLDEASQGLGYSNMIYMLLQLMYFKKSYDKQLVNMFCIEEPESHMHPQMQAIFIEKLTELYDDNSVQGILTTHSNEIVRKIGMKNLKVIRKTSAFRSELFDMEIFSNQNKSDDEELERFYEWFFEIGYSEIVFADKVVIYEGDTERLFIRKLLTQDKYTALNQQYIAFVQAGGQHAFNYRKLLDYLKIKSLIFSDIDYQSDKVAHDDIVESKVGNNTLKSFFEDSDKTLIVKDLYEDYKNKKNVFGNIGVFFQTESDGFSRTLEEAIFYRLFGLNSYDSLKRSEWINKRNETHLSYSVPNNIDGETDSDFYSRNIVKATSNRKTDFMYSLILEGKYQDAEPQYIAEGLLWLMED